LNLKIQKHTLNIKL